MSISKTKEQIAAMVPGKPYSGDWVDAPYNELPEFTASGVADFKALADSHTELLEAAKDLVNAAWQTADHYAEVDELETAIKRAEWDSRSFSR